MNVNLGCSDQLHPDFLNVDIWEPPGASLYCLGVKPDDQGNSVIDTEWRGKFRRVDLNKKWPWEDSSIDEIRAHDIFEHLKNKRFTMNEAWRVLKAGGLLDLFVPTTDGRGAFQDPTHVSFWTPNDLFYFVEDFAEWKRFAVSYGITARFRVPGCPDAATAFDKILRGHTEYPNKVWKLKVTLEAVK